MKRAGELISLIQKALQGVKTMEDGLSILDKFTTDEVYEFARGVGAVLPKYVHDLVATVEEEVTKHIPEDLQVVNSMVNINRTYRNIIRKEDTEANMISLIFLLLLKMHKDNPKLNLDKALALEYKIYLSHIIPTDDLLLEIDYNSTKGVTMETDRGYLRRTLEGELIPTRKTDDLILKKLNK